MVLATFIQDRTVIDAPFVPDLFCVDFSPKLASHLLVGFQIERLGDWKVDWEPRKHFWSVSSWQDAHLDIVVELRCEVTGETVHKRVNLALELKLSVTSVVDRNLVVGMNKLE